MPRLRPFSKLWFYLRQSFAGFSFEQKNHQIPYFEGSLTMVVRTDWGGRWEVKRLLQVIHIRHKVNWPTETVAKTVKFRVLICCGRSFLLIIACKTLKGVKNESIQVSFCEEESRQATVGKKHPDC